MMFMYRFSMLINRLTVYLLKLVLRIVGIGFDWIKFVYELVGFFG